MDKLLNQLRYIKAGAICMFFALCGNLFKGDALNNWYTQLRLPPFTLPVIYFFAMGFIFYFICGVLLYKLFSEENNKNETVFLITLVIIMMAYYTIWDLVFFGLKSPMAGFFAYIPFTLFVFYIFYRFARLYPVISIVFLPFIGWLGYAFFWLISLWTLNY